MVNYFSDKAECKPILLDKSELSGEDIKTLVSSPVKGRLKFLWNDQLLQNDTKLLCFPGQSMTVHLVKLPREVCAAHQGLAKYALVNPLTSMLMDVMRKWPVGSFSGELAQAGRR